MRRIVAAAAAVFVLAPVAQASASQALWPQVWSMRNCLTIPGPGGSRIPHRTLCGVQYTDVLLAVNARRALLPTAVGIARARHVGIQACRCQAGIVLMKAQQIAPYTRRRFAQWWADPKTPAGHHLKGCLKNAAIALGAFIAVKIATGHWDDSEVVWGTAFACGVGSVVDA